MSDQAPMVFSVTLGADGLEVLARRVAELVAPQMPATTVRASPYLTVDEAKAYLRCSRQRIYDLCSSGRLTRYRDGTRVLLRVEELDAYLRGDPAGRSSRVATLLPRGRKPA